MKNFTLATLFVCLSFFCRAQTYFVNQIAYNPLPFDSGIEVVDRIDDLFGDPINIGFDFYFFGIPYQQLLVGSNASLNFNLNHAGGHSNYHIPDPIPNNNFDDMLNTILFGFQDLDYTFVG